MPSIPMGPDAERSEDGYSTAWQQWWRYNGDPYLNLRTLVSGLSESTGGDSARAGFLPSRAEIEDLVVPALQRALQEASSAELVRGALIALARIGEGRDARGLALDDAARFYLGQDHQPTAEASLVALGLRGDPSATEMLLQLVENNDAGRELRGGEWVDARTRVFAAYALGLLARRCNDRAVVDTIGRALTRTLVADATATFELHVALMLSMGLTPLTQCDGTVPVDLAGLDEAGAHFCRGTQIVALLDYLEDDERPFELRSHASVPLARLALGAEPEYKKVVAKALIKALDRSSKEHPSLRHSCAVALGVLGDGDDDRVDKNIRDSLQNAASRGEELLRRLSMISLARASARTGSGKSPDAAVAKTQKFLEVKLATGRGDSPAWAALSLSVLGFGRGHDRGAVPAGITSALRSALGSRSADRASAAALGIGVLRDYDSHDALLARLESDESEVRSYSALALGMAGAREALPTLRAMRDDPANASDVMFMGSASIALRLLGDETAAVGLIERLDDVEDADEQVALVCAAGVLGDGAALRALVELIDDASRADAVRGAAALALGVLCDERTESWASDLATDINYNLLTWTLQDPFGDGLGVLDMR
jgi:HEAT repeat protein